MSNRFMQIIWLVLAVALVFSGCQRMYERETDMLAQGPGIDTISVAPDYVVQAIEAAGGLGSWSKTKELQLDCVITFSQPDGSSYLTEQRHVVYPWSNSIKISGKEPQGSFKWQLSKGKFKVLRDSGQINNLPVAISGGRFAEMILSVITIPARFLDVSVEFTRQTTEMKIKGQWYYPIIRRNKSVLEPARPLSEAVFYQNKDSSLVDMLLFADIGSSMRPSEAIPVSFAVRGYDYTEVGEEGIRIPSRIEIFKTDARGNLLNRLVKIDYHTLKRTK